MLAFAKDKISKKPSSLSNCLGSLIFLKLEGIVCLTYAKIKAE